MRLIPFLLGSIAAFALCHYYWIPSLDRRLHSESFVTSIRQGSLLAIAGCARAILLINVFTTLTIILIAVTLQKIGGTSLTGTTSAIITIQQWRTTLVGFGPVWGAAAIIALVVGLGIYAGRKGKKRLEPAFNRTFERELQRLEQEREDGISKALPLTRKMRQLESRILSVDRKLIEINWKGSTGAKVDKLKQRLTRNLQLLRHRYNLLEIKSQTRVVTLDPEEHELPASKTRREKAQVFLMSHGLFASLNAGSRRLFLAGFILLIPSFISVYAIKTEGILDDRLAELYVLRAQLDANDWEETKEQLGAPTTELSQEDRDMLARVARAFEVAVPIPPPPPSMQKPWYMMHSCAARQEILERAVNLSKTPLEYHHSGSQIENLDDVERGTIVLYENVLKSRGPSTPLGRDIYIKLEDIARRSPSLMEKIRAGTYDLEETASIYYMRRAMIAQILGQSPGARSGDAENLLRTSNLKVNVPLYNLAQQDRARSFIAELIHRGDLVEALRNVGTIRSPRYNFSAFDSDEYQSVMRVFEEKLPVDRISLKTSQYPPSVDERPESHVDMKKAAAKVEELIQYSRGRSRSIDSEEYIDCLAQYQDYFPGQLNAELQTERSKERLKLEGRVSATSQAEIEGESLGSFLLARNFGALRGSSRIGGVLIGRDPSDVDTSRMDCTDLEWEVQGSRVRLILTTGNGTRIRSKPHRMQVVYQALNYAADGRPIAVTMVDADPLNQLKILLHPTLSARS